MLKICEHCGHSKGDYDSCTCLVTRKVKYEEMSTSKLVNELGKINYELGRRMNYNEE